ncbi:ADP-ribosylation factor GTPase-activating protein 1 [Nematocida sp. AWRm77]|nr:ADP-ribosylation factor GTPase-activating protein 1 [Nematocida sp. AWRm77]
MAEKEVTLKEIIERSAENQKCMDCGMARPQWASITHGIFLCLNCAGVHRSFGVRVSVVKSVGMDMWPLSDIARMEKGGNKRFGALLAQYSLAALPKSQLYLERRVQEYAKQLEKEVQSVYPKEKQVPSLSRSPSSPKGSSKPVDAQTPRGSSSGQGLSSSYVHTYSEGSGVQSYSSYAHSNSSASASLPSMEAIQSNITDLLGKAAGYLYTGATTISEKVIVPASSVIREKGVQISEYIKNREKKKEAPAPPRSSSPKKPSASRRPTEDKWD